MLLSSTLLVLSSFLFETGAGAWLDKAKYDRRSLNSLPGPASDFRSRSSTSSYLTNATKPSAVNGSALPDVNFDIGESYSGLLPIDHTSNRELFFWFVPTTNPVASDEIMIWLDGGPGCSSLASLPGKLSPISNTWTWTNLTNVVWIEQPVGTGYSQGTPNVTNEIDVAAQFRGFWQNFVDLFGLHDRKVYLTGSSYAGMYVPYIADSMLDQSDTTYFDVKGILVYDPSIGFNTIMEHIPAVAFTEANPNHFPFNDSYVEHIHNVSAACGYDEYLSLLTFPPKGTFPPIGSISKFKSDIPGQRGAYPNGSLDLDCDVLGGIFKSVHEINLCFNIYQTSRRLSMPLLTGTGGAPPKKPIFVNGTDLSPPSGLTGGPLQRVIEKTNKVIVSHGALDMRLMLNGSLLTLQNLTWNGAQRFSEPPVQPFYVPYADHGVAGPAAGAGVFGGWVTERGLIFCSVDLSGHRVPGDQPSAAYRHVEFLLDRIANLSEVSGFTTQRDYPQSQQPLGLRHWPR